MLLIACLFLIIFKENIVDKAIVNNYIKVKSKIEVKDILLL